MFNILLLELYILFHHLIFHFGYVIYIYIYFIGFKPIIPMLVVGNSVIHRPSDSTGLCGLAL